MSEIMRVLHCVYGPANAAGLEAAAAFASFARSEEGGFEAFMWAPGAGDQAGAPANLAAADSTATGTLRGALALRSVIVKARIDIIHCHDTASAGIVAFLTAATRTPAAVCSVYRPLPRRSPRKPLRDAGARAFLWAMRRTFPALIAPSAYARDIMISQGSLEPEKVFAVTWGVEPVEAAPVAGEGAIRVTCLPVEVNRRRRRAAYFYFLQGARAALRQAPETTFAVACGEEDAGYIRSTAAMLAISQRVEAVDGRDLEGALARCDVAVLATGDIQGIRPLVHAMAAGRAVIAPDLRGVKEYVDAETTGLLVRQGDSQALAHSILRMASSASARGKLGTAAAAAARTRFSARRMAGDFAAIYRRTAGR